MWLAGRSSPRDNIRIYAREVYENILFMDTDRSSMVKNEKARNNGRRRESAIVPNEKNVVYCRHCSLEEKKK